MSHHPIEVLLKAATIASIAASGYAGLETFTWAIGAGLPGIIALVVAAFAGVVAFSAPLLGLLAIVLVYERKRFSVLTFGVHPWSRTTETESIGTCLNCGIEGVEGHRTRWGRYYVAFGVAWKRLDGGVHDDCAVCFADPIEGQLRRQRETARAPVAGDPKLAHMNGPVAEEVAA